MTRILILEGIADTGQEALRAAPGFEIAELYESDLGKIESELAHAEALIVRSTDRLERFTRQASGIAGVI